MSGVAPPEAASTRVLDVWLEDGLPDMPHRIGTLSGSAGAGYGITFTYAAEYLASDHAAPLSVALPLAAEPYPDPMARAFFDNLLPEGERRGAEAALRRIDSGDVVGLLAVLGAECPGAVSVLPRGDPPVKTPGRLDRDYAPLSAAQFAAIVSDAAAGRPIRDGGRFSVAGVQRKFVIARHPDTGDFLLPRRGAPSTHIIKVESTDPSARGLIANEALCLAVLRQLGLPAVSAERMAVGGIPILVIPRYDRAITPAGDVVRRHQEDAAQVLGLPRELKYEDAARVAGIAAERRGYAGLFGPFAGAMRAPVDARGVLLDAAFANFLLDNRDAHLKNFAALHGRLSAVAGVGLPLGQGLVLAPLYDAVCIGMFADFANSDMAMRIGGAAFPDEVTRSDWATLIRHLFPGRSRVPAAVVNGHIARLRQLATAILPAIDAVVANSVATRIEAKIIRDIAGARVRHLNRTMEWDIPADTDAVVLRGGGWRMS